LIGGAGFDLARYDNATAGVAVRLDMPAANTGEAAGDIFIQIEGLVGSGFSDTLVGDGDANYLFGLGGNDVLVGLGGADALLGNDGDDSLYGGAGADQLDGGEGFDFARYDDQGFVQASLDPGFGNAGAAAGDSFFNIEGLVGGTAGDNLFGNGGANQLYGLGGSDVLFGGAGADFIDGGAGTDVASYFNATAGVTARLDVAGANGGDALGDVFVSIEDLDGSNFADVLIGDAGANRLFGNGGDDNLTGGLGADTLFGGTGFDLARYDNATAGLTVRLDMPGANTGEAAGDVFFQIEGLVGSGFADSLVGDGHRQLPVRARRQRRARRAWRQRRPARQRRR
jgi:Ca2+-binding RTX toxin-like protein